MEVSGKVTPKEKSSQFATNSGLDGTPKHYLENLFVLLWIEPRFSGRLACQRTESVRFGISVRLKCENRL